MPLEQTPEGQLFHKFMDSYYKRMHKLSVYLMQCLALGLGKERNYFDKFIVHDTLSTNRLIH